MFGSSRISTKPLAGLCRRLSISLEAGVDIRTALTREVDRAQAGRHHFAYLRDAIKGGESVDDALKETGEFFPELFRSIVRVGERSGRLGEALRQLADHYDSQLRLRRRFVSAITWPMIQLIASVVIIGFLIWILGYIGQRNGMTVDILGWGLTGNRGLMTYCLIVGSIVAVIIIFIQGIRRGLAWVKPVQRLVLRIPVLGTALETLALARLAWSMHLTFDAGVSLRQALRISLESARNARYTDQIPPIDRAVEEGHSLYEAFLTTEAFPADFLDSLHAAEESGRLVEGMGRLSRQYQEQAEHAIQMLVTVAGFLVWVVIAAVIVSFIFSVASGYFGTIRDLSK